MAHFIILTLPAAFICILRTLMAPFSYAQAAGALQLPTDWPEIEGNVSENDDKEERTQVLQLPTDPVFIEDEPMGRLPLLSLWIFTVHTILF